MKKNAQPQRSIAPRLAAILVTLYPLAVQAAGPAIFDSGTILQQVQPVTPPSASSVGTGVTTAPQGNASLPSSAPLLVQTLRITGNTLFDTATLHALVADGEGTTRTLASLEELTARITDYYRKNDYPLARAIIPAQAIRDGVIVIEVIEARYGKIKLDNGSRTGTSLLEATLSPLQGGQVISEEAMDRALLLLSDIPGMIVNGTLTPGEAVGTSDLLLDTTSAPAVSGNIVLDSYGDRYTGRERIGSTVNITNPLHRGDNLSISAITSGRGLNYARIAYSTILNGLGTSIGGSYSALHYRLGEPLKALDAHGTAQVASLYVKHPLLRSRDVNVFGQIQYDSLQLRDRIDAGPLRTDRHLDNWVASLTGDARDMLFSGGVTSWSVGMTAGRVGFDDNAAQLADAASAKTRGGFAKWNASAAHLQNLSSKDTLYLSFAGQWADNNLDSSQKMSSGGPYSVRAYDTGTASSDKGYQGTVELRRDMGAAWTGQWQALAFIDSARVTLSQNVWTTARGGNHVTLSGAGVGINWAGPQQLSLRATIATPIGSTPTMLASAASVRAWIGISKGF